MQYYLDSSDKEAGTRKPFFILQFDPEEFSRLPDDSLVASEKQIDTVARAIDKCMVCGTLKNVGSIGGIAAQIKNVLELQDDSISATEIEAALTWLSSNESRISSSSRFRITYSDEPVDTSQARSHSLFWLAPIPPLSPGVRVFEISRLCRPSDSSKKTKEKD